MPQQLSLQYAAVPAQPWAALEARWLPRLPPAKSASVARRREALDRSASLLGIALLERALAARGIALDAGAIEFPRDGKPRLPGGPEFSISHGGGLVACAVAAAGCVGVDLEPAGAVRQAVARRVLGAAERARLERGELDATAAWVMKEAVVKAAGRGMAELANVELGDGRARLGARDFWLQPLALASTHVAWLACDRAFAAPVAVAVDAGEFAALPAAG